MSSNIDYQINRIESAKESIRATALKHGVVIDSNVLFDRFGEYVDKINTDGSIIGGSTADSSFEDYNTITGGNAGSTYKDWEVVGGGGANM